MQFGQQAARYRHCIEHPSNNDAPTAVPPTVTTHSRWPCLRPSRLRRVARWAADGGRPAASTGELEVLLGPFADTGQSRAERIGDHVGGIADEDGTVPQPWEPSPVLEHLAVVVRGECRFGVPAVGHRQVADDCIRPLMRRVLDRETGTDTRVAIPCGSTPSRSCPACATKARLLRIHQCAEGWHRDTELEPTESDDADVAEGAVDAETGWRSDGG